MAEPVDLIYCGVLDAEIRHVVSQDGIRANLRPIPSGLCTDSRSLGLVLRRALADRVRPAVLCLGQCVPGIDALARPYGAKRVRSSNCAAMLLGEAEYSRGLANGSYYLLPEWTERWRTVFTEQLGLTPQLAPEVLGAELREIVYLDSGVRPVPAKSLAGFAAYSHLPVSVRAVQLDRLSQLLRDTFQEVQTGGTISAMTSCAGGQAPCVSCLARGNS